MPSTAIDESSDPNFAIVAEQIGSLPSIIHCEGLNEYEAIRVISVSGVLLLDHRFGTADRECHCVACKSAELASPKTSEWGLLSRRFQADESDA